LEKIYCIYLKKEKKEILTTVHHNIYFQDVGAPEGPLELKGTSMSPCECVDICRLNGFRGVVRNNTNHFQADCYCVQKFTRRNNDTSLKSKPIWQYDQAYVPGIDVTTDDLQGFINKKLENFLNPSVKVPEYYKESLGKVSSSTCYDICLSKGANASTFKNNLLPGQEGDCFCDFSDIKVSRKSSWSVAFHTTSYSKNNPFFWKSDAFNEE